MANYRFTRTEWTRLLARLDRLGVLTLLPGNRVKLRVARVKVTYPSGLKSYSTLRVARLLAVQEGRNGPHGRTLRALGLEP